MTETILSWEIIVILVFNGITMEIKKWTSQAVFMFILQIFQKPEDYLLQVVVSD